MASAEVRLFFEELARRWDEGNSREQHHRLKNIFDLEIPLLPHPVLDLGSGTGVLVPFIRNKMSTAGNIVQFDIAGGMLKKARQKFNSGQDLCFVQGDALHLPFADATFGTVFCFQVVPHVQDKNALLQEVRRILQPHGLLVVLHLASHSRLNQMHRGLSAAVRTHLMFPVDELAAMAGACGLNVRQMREEHDLYLLTALSN